MWILQLINAQEKIENKKTTSYQMEIWLYNMDTDPVHHCHTPEQNVFLQNEFVTFCMVTVNCPRMVHFGMAPESHFV